MAGISTHILDTSRGRPAAAVPITLERLEEGVYRPIGSGVTDADGRCKTLLGDNALTTARYRLQFDTAQYFAALGIEAFFPEVSLVFEVWDANQHYHVPLLLSPFQYSTYRGS